MNERLIDLDELVLRCQDKVTQEYIKEAVACYRAGAFRSCIISTWNAVVFDFLYKLRQLELTGDGQAKDELAKFEGLRQADKKRELWTFETEIPKLAHEKFEFISLIERQDLERLNEDRSRCAHPSMQSPEEPFQATPELARYHLRSAITHLLQHPPVQGRAALQRIWDTIKSEGFPEDIEQAIQVFQDSYLARARKSLINDVVTGLTKSLLLEDKPVKEQYRMYAALAAVSQIHFEQFQTIIHTKLSAIIESVPDPKWPIVFYYLRRMKAWEHLSQGQRIKAENFIKNINKLEGKNNAYIMLCALDGDDGIRSVALEKLKTFHAKDFTPLVELVGQSKSQINPENINYVIENFKLYSIQKFIDSADFKDAVFYGYRLLLIANWFNGEEMRAVLQAFCKNDQIHKATENIQKIMINLFQKTVHLSDLVKDDWLLVRKQIDNQTSYADLAQLIDTHFPDLVLTSINNELEENLNLTEEASNVEDDKETNVIL